MPGLAGTLAIGACGTVLFGVVVVPFLVLCWGVALLGITTIGACADGTPTTVGTFRALGVAVVLGIVTTGGCAAGTPLMAGIALFGF